MLKEINCILFHCARYNGITPVITMGLWGLADILTQNGFPAKIIHTGIEAELQQNFEIKRYIHEKTVLAGASAHWFPMTAESLDILDAVKKIYPGIFTILGGYSASFFARQIMEEYLFVDGILRGDSEMPLLRLVQALKNNQQDLGSIPNLVWRRNGMVIENEFSYTTSEKHIRNIDFANFPEYLHHYGSAKDYIFNRNAAFGPGDYLPRHLYTPYFYLFTGKGCINDCSICGGGREAQKIINNRSTCFTLPVSKIMEIIHKSVKMGYEHILISNNPVSAKSQYFELLQTIRESGLSLDITFDCWRLPAEEEIIEFKNSAKTLFMLISPDTISERVRKKTRDTFYFSNKEFYRILDFLYKNKIYCYVYFSFFQPFETIEDLEATREAVWAINAKYPHYIEAYYIKISTDPGSPLFIHPEEYDVTLKIKGIRDFIKETGNIKHQENLQVHSINTVPINTQKAFSRKIEYDASIKRIFKLLTKILTRAFGDVKIFISFLDEFYKAFYIYNLLDQEKNKSREQTYTRLLLLLKEAAISFINKSCDISGYVPDIIEYVMNKKILSETPYTQSGGNLLSDADLPSCIIKLPTHSRIARFAYDILNSEKILREKKEFSIIKQRVNCLLFHKNKGNKIDIIELDNVTYDFLFLCSQYPGLSFTSILEKLGTQTVDWKQKKKVLIRSLKEMVKQNLVIARTDKQT